MATLMPTIPYVVFCILEPLSLYAALAAPSLLGNSC